MSTVFKTAESRKAIRGRYNQILAAFPFRQRYVNTSFGRTFLLETGEPEHPTLVLLHGSCSNSAFWFGELMGLSDRYHVCAVDIPGEAGNSDENRLNLTSNGYADWLGEVLDALGIEKAAVAGNSLGGWMALKFAVSYPERVEKLMLIAPAGLSEVNTAVLERAKKAEKERDTLTLDPSVSAGAALPKPVEEFINLILGGYNPITEEMPIFTDEEIKMLTMPVLFVAGDNDTMLDARGAAERLRQLLPEAEVHLLDGAGHMITNALEYLRPFLTDVKDES